MPNKPSRKDSGPVLPLRTTANRREQEKLQPQLHKRCAGTVQLKTISKEINTLQYHA